MREPQADFQPRDEAGPTHEPARVNVRATMVTGFVLVSLVIVTFALITWLISRFEHQPRMADQTGRRQIAAEQLFPEPEVDADQPEQLRNLRKTENEQLDSYGIVEKGTGIVHIPIDRAMALVAQNGLPFGKRPAPSEGQKTDSAKKTKQE